MEDQTQTPNEETTDEEGVPSDEGTEEGGDEGMDVGNDTGDDAGDDM